MRTNLPANRVRHLARLVQDHYWGHKFRMPAALDMKRAAELCGVLRSPEYRYEVAPASSSLLGSEQAHVLPVDVLWAVVEPFLPGSGESVGRAWLENNAALWKALGFYTPAQRGFSARDENGMFNVLSELSQYQYVWFNTAGSVLELSRRAES